MNKNEKRDVSVFDSAFQFGVFFGILSTWAMTLRLPMRSACGKNRMTVVMLAGPVLIGIFSEIVKTPELCYLIPVLWFSGLVNGATHAAKARSEFIDDFYPGDPKLAKTLFFFIKNDALLRFLEAPIALVIGAFLAEAFEMPGIFSYCFWGAIAMAITEASGQLHMRRFENAARKAAGEQWSVSQRLRRRWQ